MLPILAGSQSIRTFYDTCLFVMASDYQERTGYEYGQRLSGRTIRLLRILSRYDNDEISVRLDTYPLEGTTFDALSYVWGDASNKRKIRCNGKDLWVTANLYAALKAQQQPAEYIYFIRPGCIGETMGTDRGQVCPIVEFRGE